tara:strand:- start:1034 stop:1216 length:183 start_codon:yes stop_codon:yes gene_type:complete
MDEDNTYRVSTISNYDNDIPVIEMYAVKNGYILVNQEGEKYVSFDTCDMLKTIVTILNKY